MSAKAAIVGVGYAGFHALTPDVSYKELTYEAAVKAYADAGIDPRRDVDSFVSVAEDFNEGTSIFDEYTPDQLGGVLKPMHTITGDGIHGLIAAYLQVLTGAFDLVVVESHSKASNILTKDHILAYAMDPVFNRPLAVNPHFIAGLEMNRYLYDTDAPREACAQVVVKNKANALLNPAAAYPARLTVAQVLAAHPLAAPLSELDVARHADGAIVMIVASARKAQEMGVEPIWIRGAGWANGSPMLENRDWGSVPYVRTAATMAYKQAGLRSPRSEIDFAEVDDTFSYKELQHLEALGLAGEGEAWRMTMDGDTELTGDFPVNPSGGSLGVGHLLDCTGLQRALEVVLQLRGEAGARQLADVTTGLAFGWRGVPTASGACVVLSNGEGRD
jgi:acetyl-CoA C-acetyltransferase